MKSPIKVFKLEDLTAGAQTVTDLARSVMVSKPPGFGAATLPLSKVAVQQIDFNHYRVYTYGVEIGEAAREEVARKMGAAVRVEYSLDSPGPRPPTRQFEMRGIDASPLWIYLGFLAILAVVLGLMS